MSNWVEILIFMIIIIFTHLLALSTQAISGKQYFYGVYVKNIELEDDVKKQIHKDFKKRLNIALLLVIGMFLVGVFILDLSTGLNILIFTMVYIALNFVYLKKAYDDVKYLKNNYLENHKDINVKKDKIPKKIIIDTELVKAKQKIEKKFKILFGICIGLSILSLIYVIINYKSMPDTIITHWGGRGEPDGFGEKNIINVFMINFIDLSIVLMFAIMGVGMISSKTYIDTNNLEINRKKAIKYLNGMGYSFLLLTLSMQSMTTTIPIFMVKQMNIPMLLTILGCIVPIFISVAFIYYYMMLRSLKPKDKNSYSCENDDDKWIYGFIYYNKDDPSVMVEKRLGTGGSVNMATPQGKLIAIVTLVITVGSLLLVVI